MDYRSGALTFYSNVHTGSEAEFNPLAKFDRFRFYHQSSKIGAFFTCFLWAFVQMSMVGVERKAIFFL